MILLRETLKPLVKIILLKKKKKDITADKGRVGRKASLVRERFGDRYRVVGNKLNKKRVCTIEVKRK